MTLRDQALRDGFTLTRLSFTTVQTLQDVGRGLDRASAIAAYRGIAPNAASNRLASLRRLGVVREIRKEGRELLFEVTRFGRRMKWAEPAEDRV